MINYERVNVGDLVVILALSIALMASLFKGQAELSMSIASGLLGYIGGAGKHTAEKKGEKRDAWGRGVLPASEFR